MSTKKEYLVLAQHQYQVADHRWTNVRKVTEGLSYAYYGTKADAQKAIKAYVAKWNKNHRYDANGKRIETDEIGGGFSADFVCDKKLDDGNRVVAWKIRVRTVTPWEEVESRKLVDGE